MVEAFRRAGLTGKVPGSETGAVGFGSLNIEQDARHTSFSLMRSEASLIIRFDSL
jgi:hypothetical protein